MLIKQFTVLTLDKPFAMSPAISEMMERQKFVPCSASAAKSSGWVAPSEHLPDLVYRIDRFQLLCLQIEEKQVPGQVVQRALAEKCEALKVQQAREVGRKERQLLKEQIIEENLVKAFPKMTKVFALVDNANLRLIIGATGNKADTMISALVAIDADMPKMKRFEDKRDISSVLTAWLADGLPEGFILGETIKMAESGQETAKLTTLKNFQFGSEELKAHLQNAMKVRTMAVEWQDKLSFTLEEGLTVKKLKYMSLLSEELVNTKTEDQAAYFDADIVLMGSTLAELLSDIDAHFPAERAN